MAAPFGIARLTAISLDANNFLHKLIPALLTIMMDNPNELWGDANYSVVKN